ncbi:hypothetical protein [Mariniflexile sp. HMF6888]|uniref:M61 family metallopeptidase n=1 Tax=Mariniflexile sp. HMF6888 TaxID=3373086 RepID=UPI0037B1442E
MIIPKNILLTISLTLLSFVCFPQENTITTSKYHLKISRDNLRLVEVSASLEVQEPYLEMRPWGFPTEIERGWAKFVYLKSITDNKGAPINFVWNNELKKWKLDVPRNSIINLKYEVELSHDNYNWDSGGGIDARPTVWKDNTLFWVSSALIIYSDRDAPLKAEITFDIPKEWKVSTAWVKLSNRRFESKNIDELINNLIMIGNHEERLIKHDNMSITIATPANFKHRIDLIQQSLEKVLPAYKNIFGELPTANYLVCASKNTIQDGEAYTNSFHQMFIDKDLEYNKIVWANTLAHEMFHYWNGTNFIFSEDYAGNYWFSEGFTNYYSSLSLVRTEIISKEEYLRFLAYQFSKLDFSQKYANEKTSLAEAGKSKINNWHFIYGGGTTIAFILDVEIRAITKGKKSLDDFMNVLYTKYGKLYKPISVEIQIEELNYLTNSNFKPFYNQYILGNTSALDAIDRACNKAGLAISHFQSEFYLTPKENKTNSIYQSIIAPIKSIDQ